MFDTHPHITKEELIELFPSGMMPHKAMEALANEELAKDELHMKLKEIAQRIVSFGYDASTKDSFTQPEVEVSSPSEPDSTKPIEKPGIIPNSLQIKLASSSYDLTTPQNLPDLAIPDGMITKPHALTDGVDIQFFDSLSEVEDFLESTLEPATFSTCNSQEGDWEDEEYDEDDEGYGDLFTMYLCKVDKENKTVEIYRQNGVDDEEEKDLHATLPLEIQGEVNPLLESFITSLSIFKGCQLYVEAGEINVVVDQQNFREKFGLTDSIDL